MSWAIQTDPRSPDKAPGGDLVPREKSTSFRPSRGVDLCLRRKHFRHPDSSLTMSRYQWRGIMTRTAFVLMRITHAFRCLKVFSAAVAVLSAGCFGASAQGAAEGIPGRLDAGLVERFDNWEVRQPPGNKSYFLIGQPADGSGQLWLQCEHKSFLTVAISMTGKAGRQGSQKSQNVGLQVDESTPRQFNFIVFESFVALATDSPGASDDRVVAFLDALRDVRSSLVLTYDETSHQFDVSQLPKARARFLKLCGRATSS